MSQKFHKVHFSLQTQHLFFCLQNCLPGKNPLIILTACQYDMTDRHTTPGVIMFTTSFLKKHRYCKKKSSLKQYYANLNELKKALKPVHDKVLPDL